LNDLLSASKTNAAKLETLQNGINQGFQDVEIRSLSPAAQDQLRQLLRMQEEALTAISQHRILKSLEFEGMHGRFDMVDEAHSKTFRWMFGTEAQLKDDDEREDFETVVDSDDTDNEGLHQNHENESRSESLDDQLGKPQILAVKDPKDQQRASESSDALQSIFQGSDKELSEYEVKDHPGKEANQSDPGNEEHQEAKNDQGDNPSDEEAPKNDYNSLEDPRRDLKIQEDETKRLAREKLLSWLSEGEGIFHISGKLGSGKSTLMKFLCTRRGTKMELRKWAGRLIPRPCLQSLTA
jgi:hypothetical protein